MSTTLAFAPWCRRDGFDFLAFHFFLDAAVNDRLLFDFPHDVACLFIVSQADKAGVPQVTVSVQSANSICATTSGFSQTKFPSHGKRSYEHHQFRCNPKIKW
jgi:hypothetical protein